MAFSDIEIFNTRPLRGKVPSGAGKGNRNGRPRQPDARHTAQQIAFARALKAAMSARNIKASELAEQLWGSHPQIINGKEYVVPRNKDRIGVYLRGTGYPRVETLEKMAQILNVKPQDLAPELIGARAPSEMSMTVLDGASKGNSAVSLNTILPTAVALQIAGIIEAARIAQEALA